MGGEGSARQPVEDGDVMELFRAPEVLQGEGREPIEIDRRGQLVVRPLDLLSRHRQAVLETREDEDRLGTVLADDAPGTAQLAEVVLGAGEDAPARVRERRRVRIAEAVRGHA
jgi:hypothetical protein